MRLARKLSPEIVQRITDMNLKGVFFQKENRRVYPQRELAASVLGYVDVDEKGIGGIEYSLDKQIRGRPGQDDGDGGRASPLVRPAQNRLPIRARASR